MHEDDRIFTRLGIAINVLAIVALLVLVVRSFQPAFAGMLHGTMGSMMQGGEPGSMGMGMGRGNGMGNGGMGNMGNGMGMGGNSAMMTMHHAEIPAEYADLSNPVTADEASLARGAEAYNLYCVSCHGASGMGDGVAGAALDPAPAAIARTSQMLSDGYLFWRISEGGSHFSTAMPAWDAAIDEQTRWDLINYMRALGDGTIGVGLDPAAEAAMHAEMVAAGVAAGVITEADGATFLAVHDRVDAAMADRRGTGSGPMMDQQPEVLAGMVEAGTLTQAEADTFITVRDALLNAGLMQ
ncbi:MAG: cytochrome c [Caldilineaceae bacterium]|nr:cytochrome c [Caldilineaceae bacterium]